MARIIIADSTNRYDGRSFELRPLGGTESSVCHMAEELARRGHEVVCYTNCDGPIEHKDVAWRPLDGPRPSRADVHVAVQHPPLLRFARAPRRRVLWMMWKPNHLKHYGMLARIWRYRPRTIFISKHQRSLYEGYRSTFLRRLAFPRLDGHVVDLGLPETVRNRPPLETPPPPRAIFASNPSRNLRWLIELWDRAILPQVPGAELHIYGIRDAQWVYGQTGVSPIEHHLPPGLSAAGRASLKPQPIATREMLWEAMRSSRAMLYGGHHSEMFCLSVAEAQALGTPAVIRPVAVLPERVRDGETGFIRADDQGFAEAAVRLLTDESLWRRQHLAALRLQQGRDWADCAAEFERALLRPSHA